MRLIARAGLAGFWAKAPALGCARLVLGAPLEKVEAGDGEWFCGAVYEVTVVMGSRVRLRERVWRVFGTKALSMSRQRICLPRMGIKCPQLPRFLLPGSQIPDFSLVPTSLFLENCVPS